MTTTAGAPSSYTCRWCNTTSTGQAPSCPGCGAPVDIRARVTDSGWVELPPIKDMARIQFGQSSAQVAGTWVPSVDMNLAPGDSVYFSHHVLLWQDMSVQLGTQPMRGAWSRMMAGMPLIMMEAAGPGHIAFSYDAPGEVVAVPLHPGAAIEVRENHFLVATAAVTYDWEQSGVWFTTGSGDDTEWHYPVGRYIDRFYAQSGTPGLVFLHARGNSFVRTLRPGETILVKPPSLLYKDPTVRMQLHVEYPRSGVRFWRSWGNRYLWLRLWGPGRVAVQSAYEHMEDPGSGFTSTSGHTEFAW
ncbi:MAG TPA: AIM24 family protein [Acidimicrobiales bacterium]|jgi:uncharacterized protein (AIM24 family)|nr:AIM24 family protein [Acidimicrobiales bacterium]